MKEIVKTEIVPATAATDYGVPLEEMAELFKGNPNVIIVHF
jgi:hypothetical protein